MQTYPTKFGRMVQDRAFVRIGMLFSRASARLGKATKKGPEQLISIVTIFEYRKCSPFHADRPERRMREGCMIGR